MAKLVARKNDSAPGPMTASSESSPSLAGNRTLPFSSRAKPSERDFSNGWPEASMPWRAAVRSSAISRRVFPFGPVRSGWERGMLDAALMVAVEGCLPDCFAAVRRSFLLRGWLSSSAIVMLETYEGLVFLCFGKFLMLMVRCEQSLFCF